MCGFVFQNRSQNVLRHDEYSIGQRIPLVLMNVNRQDPSNRQRSIPRKNVLEGTAVARASVQLDNFIYGHYSRLLVPAARTSLRRHGRRDASTMTRRNGRQLSGFFQMTRSVFPGRPRACRFSGGCADSNTEVRLV
jgi:hypothetical protein